MDAACHHLRRPDEAESANTIEKHLLKTATRHDQCLSSIVCHSNAVCASFITSSRRWRQAVGDVDNVSFANSTSPQLCDFLTDVDNTSPALASVHEVSLKPVYFDLGSTETTRTRETRSVLVIADLEPPFFWRNRRPSFSRLPTWRLRRTFFAQVIDLH